ncbi:hypothetical protein JXA48_02240 [Candidatus Woesearchaeota archaeon]|nr:hypothetical protein [Candidatus Woesearchaeota archaeon]
MGDIKLYKNGLRYIIDIPKDDVSHATFFSNHFRIRDHKRGFPVTFQREESLDDIVRFNFNTRDFLETLFDKYSSDDLFPYLRYVTKTTDEAKVCFDELESSEQFYEFGYVIRANSGNNRWGYYQVYVPGRSKDDLKKMFFSKYHSTSKHKNNRANGFSPLLRLSTMNFLDYMANMPPTMKISEQKYLMSKMATGRLSTSEGKDFVDKLLNLTVDNADKLYLRMLKRWAGPIILFDNTNDLDRNYDVDFDNYNLSEDMLKFFYPVFRDEKYPIPDLKFENGEFTTMTPQEAMFNPRGKPNEMARILLESKKHNAPEARKMDLHILNRIKELQAEFEDNMRAMNEF